MEVSKPVVIVLSRNYSTGLGIIRSLGVAGYTVDLIASVKKKGSSCIASSSKYIRNSIEVLTPKIYEDDGKDIIDSLWRYVENREEHFVLFPTDDFTTAIVDRYRVELSNKFIMPYVWEESQYTMSNLMDKTVQSEIAKSVGLKTPMEWQIDLSKDIEIPKDLVFPCFLKPLKSISGYKTEMAVCKDVEELKQKLLEMKNFYCNRDVLIQEYLNIDKEYDVAGLCLDQDIIIPGIIEKTKIAKYECGISMCGKVIKKEKLKDTINKIEKMLRRFHYVGMFDIDLNVCDGEVYFGEVNLRSGGLNYAYYLSGVNMPDILIKYFNNIEIDEDICKIKNFDTTFIYEKVAWEDYIHSYISKKELNYLLGSVDNKLLEDDEDPKPGNVFNKKIRLSLVKNKLKSILHIK